jgi:hypothetical protein
MFKAQRRGPEESLGDFAARVGFDALREFQAAYISPAEAEKLPKVRAGEGGAAVGNGRADSLFERGGRAVQPEDPSLTASQSLGGLPAFWC